MKYGLFNFFVNMYGQIKRTCRLKGTCRDNWEVTYKEKWSDKNYSRYQNVLPGRNFWELLEVSSMNFKVRQKTIIIDSCFESHCSTV